MNQKSENIFAENPLDISNFFKGNKSLHAKMYLVRESGKVKDGKPLSAFADLSRVELTIVNKTETPKYVNVSIQYEKLAEIKARGRFALQTRFKRELMQDAGNENENDGENKDEKSPAYTYVIPMGKLKGKTPAQVILGPNGPETLKQHYQWLKDNLKNYPNNQKQMDIIRETCFLYKDGKLKGNAMNETFNILKAEPLPLTREKNKNADGTYPVREVSIDCILSMNYPFEVTIVNYDAPIKKEPSGQIKVVKEKRSNEFTKTFKLSVGEFERLLNHIEIAETIFLNSYSTVLMKEAIEADAENRKNISAEKKAE